MTVSLILIIIPFILLSEASYFYPRMGYGYFANVNNLIRFTHSLDKPLVTEHFTNIHSKKTPNIVVEQINDNQLKYTDTKEHLKIFALQLPTPQNLDEQRFPENYEPHILNIRRSELNKAFHKHYYIDSDILDKTKIFDHLFVKGAIGAHIRFAGHYINTKINFNQQIKSYTDYIDQSNYYYVYLATHLKDVEDIFRKKYGTRLIIYEHYRNPDKNSDWISNNLSQIEEDTNVLIDMILLSKCKEIVGGPSNVFYAALWYNLQLKFYIPDLLKTVIVG